MCSRELKLGHGSYSLVWWQPAVPHAAQGALIFHWAPAPQNVCARHWIQACSNLNTDNTAATN